MEAADPRTIQKQCTARGPRIRHCRCGACPQCQENARWDRIFNERFADPDYYKRTPARFGSSMNWLSGDDAV
jgi:hypothetical protein